ncbi:MAG: dTDP-4-dehydrorhamnose reductase [Candidatus Doudnabacteria bacterium]
MKVLILGAKGSLGQTFADVYKDQEVIAWDKNELDITDEDAVAEKITGLMPDIVINCAAYNSVDKAEDERETADLINGYAVGFIAKACDSAGATLVHYSTGQIFDGSKSEGYNEDDQPGPVNFYGKSKLLGEMQLQEYAENFYLIRTCWLYGRPAEGKKSFTDIMLELATGNTVINATKDEFGKPTYVKDLAEATRALVDEKKPFGIYHLTNSGIASRFDWANEIFTIRKNKALLEAVNAGFFPRKAKRPKYEVLNNTKFIQLRPWTEALKEYLSSTNEN